MPSFQEEYQQHRYGCVDCTEADKGTAPASRRCAEGNVLVRLIGYGPLLSTRELRAMWVNMIQQAQQKLTATGLSPREFIDSSIQIAQELRAAACVDFLQGSLGERTTHWARGQVFEGAQYIESWLRQAPLPYAQIEVVGTGVFASMDGGATWKLPGFDRKVSAASISNLALGMSQVAPPR